MCPVCTDPTVGGDLCLDCRLTLRADGDKLHAALPPGVRFLAHFDTDGPIPEHDPLLGPCWPWTGALDADGYGHFRVEAGLVVDAHRWVFEQIRGPIPPKLQVDHLCHHPGWCTAGRACPHRRCVNPAHLAAVDRRTNLLRSGSVVAVNAAKTHCLNDHPLDGPNLYRHPTRDTRHCRACQQARGAQWDAEHRRATDGNGAAPY